MQQAEIARTQAALDQQRNEDNQHAKIMSDYLDAMTKLLLENPTKDSEQIGKVSALNLLDSSTRNLGEGNKISTANMIARARTLNTLRQLDGVRKGQLLKFLYEAGLVRQCQFNPTTGDVHNCSPSKLTLTGAKLNEVAFENPIPLPGVDLARAWLPDAQLSEVDLTEALLEKATLRGLT